MYVMIGAMSTAVGAHRLWAHRSFKATWQLSVLLMICNSTLFLKSIYIFVRDHRVHHKFTETDADPHNYNRGIFFSHIGWLMLKKHPDVRTKGATIDMSDLRNDKIVMFQHKYSGTLTIIWFSPLIDSILCTTDTIFCWCPFLHSSCQRLFRTMFLAKLLGTVGMSAEFCATLLVCSWCFALTALHIPIFCQQDHTTGLQFILWILFLYNYLNYFRFIRPSDHKSLSILMFGENSHNFHHTFPWDYKSSELNSYIFDVSTSVIHLMHRIGMLLARLLIFFEDFQIYWSFSIYIGWAYDLRTVSQDIIDKRVARTGDGSRLDSTDLRRINLSKQDHVNKCDVIVYE